VALSLSPEQRRLRAQIAANTRWSKENPKEGIKPARAAYERRFESEVDPDGALPESERKRRAGRHARSHAASRPGILASSKEGLVNAEGAPKGAPQAATAKQQTRSHLSLADRRAVQLRLPDPNDTGVGWVL
jgi:hypothetical protein